MVNILGLLKSLHIYNALCNGLILLQQSYKVPRLVSRIDIDNFLCLTLDIFFTFWIRSTN